ncbi:hypothetical protein KZZ52_28795 [Dactylosporangium sp. AC04546]|uniref:hypothetical protein n=1 Tax=Dactylosporangium sp. AC04546 TaxID=2862460 RepID=UPI001EDD8CFE|nr:hypothetical protein [Dactylosporangium sp. AC04546]WVK89269.1 hypothetical protein KZZ52_28795 [Dactylosporangium sp. AC04546]
MLIVARLTVRSSYRHDREEPATADAFDTVRFHLPAGGTELCRVRTFALDHDIHVVQLTGRPSRCGRRLNDVVGKLVQEPRFSYHVLNRPKGRATPCGPSRRP